MKRRSHHSPIFHQPLQFRQRLLNLGYRSGAVDELAFRSAFLTFVLKSQNVVREGWPSARGAGETSRERGRNGAVLRRVVVENR